MSAASTRERRAASGAASWISPVGAAGVQEQLDRRRAAAAQRRRPGYRLRSGLELGDVEMMVRRRADPETAARIDSALRALGGAAAAAGTPPPGLTAVVSTSRDLLLQLGEPAAPIPPFASRGSRSRKQRDNAPPAPRSPKPAGVWRLDPGLLDSEGAMGHPAPYPTLAPLGTTPSGNLVLVDLDRAQAIGLTGARDAIVEVLTALALDMACCSWTTTTQIVLVGFGERLAHAMPDRLQYASSFDVALEDLARGAVRHRAAQNSAPASDTATTPSRPRTPVPSTADHADTVRLTAPASADGSAGSSAAGATVRDTVHDGSRAGARSPAVVLLVASPATPAQQRQRRSIMTAYPDCGLAAVVINAGNNTDNSTAPDNAADEPLDETATAERPPGPTGARTDDTTAVERELQDWPEYRVAVPADPAVPAALPDTIAAAGSANPTTVVLHRCDLATTDELLRDLARASSTEQDPSDDYTGVPDEPPIDHLYPLLHPSSPSAPGFPQPHPGPAAAGGHPRSPAPTAAPGPAAGPTALIPTDPRPAAPIPTTATATATAFLPAPGSRAPRAPADVGAMPGPRPAPGPHGRRSNATAGTKSSGPRETQQPPSASGQPQAWSGLRWSRRWSLPMIAAAIVVVLLAVGGGWLLRDAASSPDPQPPLAVLLAETDGGTTTEAAAGSVQMTAGITRAPGWIRIAVDVAGLPAQQQHRILARTSTGSAVVVATWVTPPRNAAPPLVVGSIAVNPDDVVAVEVENNAGDTVVAADLL